MKETSSLQEDFTQEGAVDAGLVSRLDVYILGEVSSYFIVSDSKKTGVQIPSMLIDGQQPNFCVLYRCLIMS